MFGNLWFEFLTLSPSYELARRQRTGTLSAAEKKRLPSDFDTALKVYDDLGDVQRILFDDWWLAKGIRFFGYQGERPSVQAIEALLAETPDPLDRLARRAEKYIQGKWHEQGQQPSLILAIPIGLPKARLIQQIADILEQAPMNRKQLNSSPPKYRLHGKKRDLDSLFRYLKCITVKAHHPEAKLWEVGVVADLSTTYSARLAKGQGSVEDQQSLKILASRAISRGMMIAENAARGVFPSYDKNEHAVSPDWKAMGELVENRQSYHDETATLEI